MSAPMSVVANRSRRSRTIKLPILGAVLLVTLIAYHASVGASAAIAQSPPEPQLGDPVSLEPKPTDAQPQFTGCGGVFVAVVNATFEQEVVESVNAFRAANGVPPLKRVEPLDDAARYHSADMAQDRYFSHDSYDRDGGSLAAVCSWDARLRSYYTNIYTIGENIAAGYPNPGAVMDGWKNSSGHRANMLNQRFWEIGVGYYYDGASPYHRYWAQDFGRRRNVYPLIINGEAATTDSRNVSLYIYGDWSEIRLRNDGGSWSSWQTFSNTMSWRLRDLGGQRTVHAELRSGSTTATTSDTILLDIEPAGLCLEYLITLAEMWHQEADPPADIDIDRDGIVTVADIIYAADIGPACQ